MSLPIQVCDVTIKKFLGLVSVNIVVDDRRPDLFYPNERFKTLITVYVLGHCWLHFHSNSLVRVLLGDETVGNAVDLYIAEKESAKDHTNNLGVDTKDVLP